MKSILILGGPKGSWEDIGCYKNGTREWSCPKCGNLNIQIGETASTLECQNCDITLRRVDS